MILIGTTGIRKTQQRKVLYLKEPWMKAAKAVWADKMKNLAAAALDRSSEDKSMMERLVPIARISGSEIWGELSAKEAARRLDFNNWISENQGRFVAKKASDLKGNWRESRHVDVSTG